MAAIIQIAEFAIPMVITPGNAGALPYLHSLDVTSPPRRIKKNPASVYSFPNARTD